MPRKLTYEEQFALKTAKAVANIQNAGTLDASKLEAALAKAGLALVTKEALTHYENCARTVSCL